MQKVTEKNLITTFKFKPLYNVNQKIKVYDTKELIEISNKALLEPHRITFYGFLFIIEGQGSHYIDHKEISIQAGDVLIIFPGQIHSYVESDLLKSKAIAFEEDIFISTNNKNEVNEIYEILNNLCKINKLSTNSSVIKKLLKLTNLIEQETKNEFDDNQNHILKNLLSTVLYILNRQISNQHEFVINKVDKNLALQYKSLILKNLNVKNNVDFFITKLKTTKKNLQKATKNTFNMTPKLTIMELLILESKRLLIDPEIQIQEVAYRLGFNEPTNFTKFFKKFTNITPEVFRKNNLLK